MASSSLSAIDDLINTFDTESSCKKITVTKRVVKVEKFSEDYHDFDMNALKNNKALMQQLLAMEQEESKQNNTETITINAKSYLPSNEELKQIKENLSDSTEIELTAKSLIKNHETKFKIDRFQFGIQFMIFPKAFIHVWLGFIGTITKNQNPMNITSSNSNYINVIKQHYLPNLMISIPHRKPLSDEYGQTSMSSMVLLSSASNDNAQQQMSSNDFLISSNDLALKLSKILTKISKCTVQISCDIPAQVLNAPMAQRNRLNQETSIVFKIEEAVMSIHNNLKEKSMYK